MPTFRCSMFGHILYDDNLTYQELLEREDEVKQVVKDVLSEHGAEHFDFTGQADSLLFECVLPEMNRDGHHDICNDCNRLLGSSLLARFSFMDKEMGTVEFYFLGRGKYREQIMSIPGPKEALSGWQVRPERKAMGELPAVRREMALKLAEQKKELAKNSGGETKDAGESTAASAFGAAKGKKTKAAKPDKDAAPNP